jgi:hypothetical protein
VRAYRSRNTAHDKAAEIMNKMKKFGRVSELLLLILLLVMIGFVRVYYGGETGLIFVWKGQFSYMDTLVNLDEVRKTSRFELQRDRPLMYWQLEEMGLYEPSLPFVRRRRPAPIPGADKGTAAQEQLPAPDSGAGPSNRGIGSFSRTGKGTAGGGQEPAVRTAPGKEVPAGTSKRGGSHQE